MHSILMRFCNTVKQLKQACIGWHGVQRPLGMSEFKLKNVASRVPCPGVHGECWGARVKLLRGARACSALGACISDTLS